MYKEKQIFLISDENWQDVLSLVPLTTWTVSEGHPDLDWCNVLNNEDGSVKEFNEKDVEGNVVKNYVCGYPTLVYHEENFESLKLHKSEFIENTEMPVAWTFKDDVLAEGSVNSDEFVVSFYLSDDMYDLIKVKKTTTKMNMDLIVTSLGSGENDIKYDIYLNEVKLPDQPFELKEGGAYLIDGVIWGSNDRRLLKKGENKLTFKRNGGNIAIRDYKLFTDYLGVDPISNYCLDGENMNFNLCIKDVEINKQSVLPNEEFIYSIIVENESSQSQQAAGYQELNSNNVN